jgi:hypothetical protein
MISYLEALFIISIITLQCPPAPTSTIFSIIPPQL